MEQSKNGYVRWSQLVGVSIGLLSIIVTISIFFASQVIANDRMRVAENQRIESCVNDKIDVIARNVERLQTDVTWIKSYLIKTNDK